MKQLLLLFGFTLFLFLPALSQEHEYFRNCEDESIKWDTVHFDKKVFEYLLVQKSFEHAYEDEKEMYTGCVLLRIDTKQTDSLSAIEICKLISNKIRLEKFWIFKTCKAYRMFNAPTGARNETDKKYLLDNCIGRFDNAKYR